MTKLSSLRKRIMTLLAALVFQATVAITAGHAQGDIRIAYFSFDTVMKALPAYTLAQRDIEELKKQYDEEMKMAEEEFNAKYEDFLEHIDGLAISIRRKRQTELQDIMDRNIAFRNEAQRLLKQVESDAMTPLRDAINNTIATIAKDKGYIIVLNTDNNAAPYIDGNFSIDITQTVIDAMK